MPGQWSGEEGGEEEAEGRERGECGGEEGGVAGSVWWGVGLGISSSPPLLEVEGAAKVGAVRVEVVEEREEGDWEDMKGLEVAGDDVTEVVKGLDAATLNGLKRLEAKGLNGLLEKVDDTGRAAAAEDKALSCWLSWTCVAGAGVWVTDTCGERLRSGVVGSNPGS